ncbi:hypothetical protein PFICI_06880 [Pestalotiopsis fici W106-1]|uniref:Fucose-specific lectin n=1 Tax=Pestalotiopsis fici (strain W106-1 / CGMCC3.15140) TaxID=1229662 RepID=W3X6Y9_PESFW|nr:uncharacterized protein PFICI_06880 [Pestalotiopsis fici W106-1]ETS81878.1 hypothetical protein PFICI_06880 [Pestalotiopsis fici W106-1]
MDHYSTLEVDHNQHSNPLVTSAPAQQDYERFPEAVTAAPGSPPHYIKSTFDADQSQKISVPEGVLAPEAVPGQNLYQNVSTGQDTTGAWTAAAAAADESLAEKKPQGKRQRICGLERRTFLWVAVIAAVLAAAALAGGLAGGLTHGSSSSSTGAADANRVNVMATSSLAASNWTDGRGYNHRIVFFQDPWNSVIARRWDSQNQTWATSNVTASAANSASPLVAAAGTTLASAALDWPNAYNVHVYFLDPWNIVRSAYSDSPVQLPDLWKNDTLGSAQLHALSGSKLAAAWARGSTPTDVGVWTVAWQGPDRGFIKVANFSDYSAGVNAVDANKVAGNTSLALVPQYGGVQDNLGLISQSFTSETAGPFQVSSFNQTWNKNPDDVIPDVPLPASNQHVAVTKWGTWSRTLCYALLDDGTMRGSWWEDEAEQNALSSLNFDGGPTANFSSIAMTLDAMFYGINGDEIHEYSVDGTDASRLNYVGRIYP